ncbi:MAG: TonB family protein [Candidatus Omnitrophota bacterium]|jgi:pilus assembly protein CpaC|nr:MAG: TonB family protein [Candidatus Omnitrophota bacterium]
MNKRRLCKGFMMLSLFLLGLNSVISAAEVKLYMGETKVLAVSSPTRIAIGNPSVADVSNVNSNSITLVPKGLGSTSLVLWDIYGEQAYTLRVLPENIDYAKKRIDELLKSLNLPEVYTKSEEDEGRILLLGRVKTPQDRERISVLLGALKDKTIDLLEVREEEAVIEIDVQVLELNKDATKALGLTNPLSTQDGYSITEVGSPGLTGAKWSELFKVLSLKRTTAFNWTLFALVQEGKARILSRPRLACQSGKEAELLVGGEKPIFTTQVASAGGQGTEVEYKEYGIKLKIKPTISEEKRVKLALNVEVSEVGDAEIIGSVEAPTAKAFPLTKRTASTELFLDDGQTMAIGGLIKSKSEEDYTKTPGLADIPIFGMMFRKKSGKVGGGTGERGDSELYITLTPKVISEKIPAKKSDNDNKNIASSDQSAGVEPTSTEGVYAGLVQQRILKKISYPLSAKKAGFQGTVRLSLIISYQGELLGATIKDSSGYRVLDENAIAAARSVSSYPPFPSSIDSEEIEIEVPIVYQLN